MCPEFRIEGRTDLSEIPTGIIDYIDEIITCDNIKDIFGNKHATIFGEEYGPKIQTYGSGYTNAQKFIVFDININGHWLIRKNVEEICDKLGLECVPYLGKMNVEDATRMVKNGFSSTIQNSCVQAEGLIGRTTVPLYDAKMNRLICKLKTIDFI